MFYAQLPVDILGDTPGPTDDLVRGCARNCIHRQQKGLARARIGEVDRDDDSNSHADADKR